MTNILANPKKLIALALIVCLMFSMFPLQAAQAAPEDYAIINSFEIKANGTISMTAETGGSHDDQSAVYAVIFTKSGWANLAVGDPDGAVSGTADEATAVLASIDWTADGSLDNFLAKGQIEEAAQAEGNQALVWENGNSALAANADYILLLYSNTLTTDGNEVTVLPFTTKADKSYIYTDYAFSLAQKSAFTPAKLTADGTTKEATAVYTLTNDGQKALDDITISIDGADFSITAGGDTTSLAVGGSADITVKFSKAAATAGTYTGTLKAVSTKVGGDAKAATAALSVKVDNPAPTYGISAKTTPAGFGTVTYGDAQPAAQNVVFTNDGNVAQNITATVTGTGASAFAIGGSPANNVAAGADATFTIQPKANIKPGTYTVKVKATSANNAAGAESGEISITVGKKTVTIGTGFAASDKVYDGNTTATVKTLPAISGKVGTDNVVAKLKGTATFADANAATGKTVTAEFELDGPDKGYYTFDNTGATKTATAAIKPAAVVFALGSASGAGSSNAEYDVATKAAPSVKLNGAAFDAAKYEITYEVTNAGTTGLATGAVATGKVTPTAQGTATIAVKATLKDTNYTFAADNSVKNTDSKDFALTVAAGIYTIKYDANGGAGTINDLEAAVGNNATLSDGTGFTKDHAVLKGWAKDKTATTAEYALGASVDVGGADKETVTLYAVWAPTYTVTVNGTVLPTEYEAGATATITAPEAEENYAFKEWQVISPEAGVTLADATAETTTFTMPAEAVEVKAIYSAELTNTPITDISMKTAELAEL